MAVTFIRTVIVFITLVVIMRLMGKRQIGEMQPYEFIVTLIIADLACIPMTDVSIPLIYGVVAILGLFLLHQVFAILEQSGSFCKRVISGKPSLVINKDGVDSLELKRNNLGVEDLIESLRTQGYFSLDDVDYAVFESNGKLSTMQNPNKQNDQKNTPSIPLLLVSDGRVNLKNTGLIKLQKADVDAFLKENGATLKKVEVLTVDGNGRSYLKEKNRKYQILDFALKENIQW